MSETGVRERLSVEQWGVLASLLLDFQAYPGRYAVVMREPRLLFERATEILMLAAGRAVEGLPEEPELETRLREAARFFCAGRHVAAERGPLCPAGPRARLRSGNAA